MEDAANAPLIREDSAEHSRDAALDFEHDEDTAELKESELRHPNLFVWTLTFTSGISGLLFGYDTGVISATLVSIGSDLSHRDLTTLDKSLITSCTSLFALIASPTTGMLADWLGRKRVILLADVLFVAGSVWQSYTQSVWGMIAGRGVVGLAVGGASLVVPLYIAELSPSPFRGRLVTLSILFITIGQVVSYIIGYVLSTHAHGWRWMVGLGALPAAIQFLILAVLPESPRWLVKSGRVDEARRVLDRVFGGGQHTHKMVDGVLWGIEKEVMEEEEATRQRTGRTTPGKRYPLGLGRIWESWEELLGVAGNRRALAIACMLQALQQLCGFVLSRGLRETPDTDTRKQNSLMYFSATIFALVGFSSPTLTSLAIAITNFLFTLVALVLIDRVGRRRILLYTIPVMIIGLVLCSFAFAFVNVAVHPGDVEHGGNDDALQGRLWPMTILAAMVVYVCGYATGIGNVAWQQSELFPLSVRSQGSGVATGMNWGSNFLVGLTFLPMMESMTPTGTFALYALICGLGWAAVWRMYPETKGLKLEEIRGVLEHGWGVKASLRRGAGSVEG
ncbi:MAG: hypothetical protein M1832_003994 [Thelocarpon impressellum]|nr:MAG: hypothetical protein M1832_003994 [Thelocarpon impressellum]